MDSILTSIKKLLGIDPMCDHFDPEIITHINSVFSILNQLGVGPPNGFVITSNAENWSSFLSDNQTIESVKSYTYLKVKLLFDPPQSSYAIESINRLISELEWRIQVAVDQIQTEDQGGVNP